MEHGNLGRKQSSEWISKRVDACRKTGVYEVGSKRMIELNKTRRGISLSEEQKAKISKSMLGKQNSLGVKKPIEVREYLSTMWKNNPKHNHWIDGKSSERRGERLVDMGRLEYRLWREGIFQRDNWTCVHCGQHGGYLEADHIKLYSLYPELRYDITNGRTLCKPCHQSRDKWVEVPV